MPENSAWLLTRRATRRSIVRISAMLALTSAAGAVLAACGGTPATSTAAPAATAPPQPTTPPISAATAAPTAAPKAMVAAAPTTAPTAQAASSSSAGKTLIVAVPVVAVGADPDFNNDLAAFELYFNTYEPLFNYPEKLNQDGLLEPLYEQKDIVPALAEKAEYSQDGKTFTIHLRKGLKSNFGNEFTADDYMWRLQRAEALHAVGFFHLYFATGVTSSKQAKVLDKYTIQYTTDQPSALLYNMNAHTASCVIDSTEAKKHITPDDPWAAKWLSTHTAGWGPYQVDSWTAGQEIVLVPNPNYYGDKPKFSKIIYRAVPSAANRLALIKTGAADVAEWLEPQEFLSLKGQAGVRVDSWRSNLQVYIPMVETIKPFDNKLVRQAFAYAFPYKEVLSTVYLNTARPSHGPVVEFFPSFYDFWHYDTNLDKAATLLKQAGVGTGLKTQIFLDAIRTDHEQLSVLFKGNLAKIGVNLDIVKLPTGEFYSRRAKQDMPMFVNLDMAGEPDGGFALGVWMDSHSGLPNASNYSNPQVDKIIADARSTIDLKKRDDDWKQVQQMVMDDANYIHVAEPGYHLAVRDNVKGAAWGLLNDISWEFADKT